MKAIVLTTTGSPDLLNYQDIDEPEMTSASQIKVKLAAAGVNPVDTKIRRNGLFYDNTLPAVLGCDGAGTVVEVGAQVTRFKAGDKVWFCHGGLGREQGNYAQYTVLDERWAGFMPSTLSFTEAAGLPLVLISAWGALFERGGLKTGQTVLIHAGAGGVSHVAIQLAKIKGAKVITTVSDAEKARFVQSLGADHIICYKETDIASEVLSLTDGQGADLVVDTVGSCAVMQQSIAAAKYFGRIVTLLALPETDYQEARIKNLLLGFELMLTPMLRDLADARRKHIEILNQCAQWLDQGLLKTHVSSVFSLDQAREAHRLMECGHTIGKLVLAIAQP
jgi:NADPH2:quinone reductase